MKSGSDSKIIRPCPHCRSWVAPERENLVGWQDAGSEEEAAVKAFWICPECGEGWSEEERKEAAKSARLLHRGQEVDKKGAITGELPQTQTLGFRWSAIDNPFVTAADLGAEEWKTKRVPDRDSSEKKMRQFVWALPFEPPEIDITPLDPAAVAERTGATKRGVVPRDSVGIAVQVDTGKRALHWTAMAVCASRQVVIEYDKQVVEADRLGVFRGLLESLRRLREYFARGWNREGDGEIFGPSQVWIDSGYHEHTDAVYAFCEEANKGCETGKEIYRPTMGFGDSQRNSTKFRSPID